MWKCRKSHKKAVKISQNQMFYSGNTLFKLKKGFKKGILRKWGLGLA